MVIAGVVIYRIYGIPLWESLLLSLITLVAFTGVVLWSWRAVVKRASGSKEGKSRPGV
jgi:hypothetical protein